MGSLHKISVSVSIFLFCLTARGGDPFRLSAGAAEAGMGYACLTREAFWSSFHNQSILSLNRSLAFGLNYENRFGIKELATRTAGLIIPAGNASFGAIYNYFGYHDFRRESAGIACGLKISDNIAAGVQADYFSETTSGEYSAHRYLTFEAGLLYKASDNVSIGMHVFNPLPQSLVKAPLPMILRTGAGIKLGQDIFAAIEGEMSTGRKLVIRTGFEYEALQKLCLRGGFISENASFSFGLGYRLNFMRLDLGFITHEKLGVTSSASLIFRLNKN